MHEYGFLNTNVMKAIPNCITFSRIILSLVLLFLKPLSAAFYAVYIICGLSDIIDGIIARRTGTVKGFGAKLDSLADMVMAGVVLFLIYPVVNPPMEVLIWVILIALVKFASMAAALKKYKTFAGVHTYGNKFTGIILFIFPMMLPFNNSDMLIYIICTVASISALEELIIQLTSSSLELNKKSIFHTY